jgi:hypothetical protein
MITDRNKAIATITYNHLNLPAQVTKTNGEHVYIYTAAGVKLRKEVYDSVRVLKKKTDYLGEYFYENDNLKFIDHQTAIKVVTDHREETPTVKEFITDQKLEKIELKSDMKSLSLKSKFLKIMDIAVKKVELIEWLVRLRDEKLIQRIEILKKGSIKEAYDQRTPKTMEELQAKLDQSEEDISSGKVHSQQEVEDYFKARFNQ